MIYLVDIVKIWCTIKENTVRKGEVNSAITVVTFFIPIDMVIFNLSL